MYEKPMFNDVPTKAEPEEHEKLASELIRQILNHPDNKQVAIFDLVRKGLLDAREKRAACLKEQVSMLNEDLESLYKGSEYIAKG